ncbi:MAG: hypothetical protein HY581_09165, partial [Nitrospirae bacterium]|nr:hypothetical protein [Nitrospirota bacterium]
MLPEDRQSAQRPDQFSETSLTPNPEPRTPNGFHGPLTISMDAVQRLAHAYGLTLNAVELTNEELVLLRYPAIVALDLTQDGQADHYVLLTHIDEARVYYLESDGTRETLPTGEFLRLFARPALVVSGDSYGRALDDAARARVHGGARSNDQPVDYPILRPVGRMEDIALEFGITIGAMVVGGVVGGPVGMMAAIAARAASQGTQAVTLVASNYDYNAAKWAGVGAGVVVGLAGAYGAGYAAGVSAAADVGPITPAMAASAGMTAGLTQAALSLAQSGTSIGVTEATNNQLYGALAGAVAGAAVGGATSGILRASANNTSLWSGAYHGVVSGLENSIVTKTPNGSYTPGVLTMTTVDSGVRAGLAQGFEAAGLSNRQAEGLAYLANNLPTFAGGGASLVNNGSLWADGTAAKTADGSTTLVGGQIRPQGAQTLSGMLLGAITNNSVYQNVVGYVTGSNGYQPWLNQGTVLGDTFGIQSSSSFAAAGRYIGYYAGSALGAQPTESRPVPGINGGVEYYHPLTGELQGQAAIVPGGMDIQILGGQQNGRTIFIPGMQPDTMLKIGQTVGQFVNNYPDQVVTGMQLGIVAALAAGQGSQLGAGRASPLISAMGGPEKVGGLIQGYQGVAGTVLGNAKQNNSVGATLMTTTSLTGGGPSAGSVESSGSTATGLLGQAWKSVYGDALNPSWFGRLTGHNLLQANTIGPEPLIPLFGRAVPTTAPQINQVLQQYPAAKILDQIAKTDSTGRTEFTSGLFLNIPGQGKGGQDLVVNLGEKGISNLTLPELNPATGQYNGFYRQEKVQMTPPGGTSPFAERMDYPVALPVNPGEQFTFYNQQGGLKGVLTRYDQTTPYGDGYLWPGAITFQTKGTTNPIQQGYFEQPHGAAITTGATAYGPVVSTYVGGQGSLSGTVLYKDVLIQATGKGYELVTKDGMVIQQVELQPQQGRHLERVIAEPTKIDSMMMYYGTQGAQPLGADMQSFYGQIKNTRENVVQTPLRAEVRDASGQVKTEYLIPEIIPTKNGSVLGFSGVREGGTLTAPYPKNLLREVKASGDDPMLSKPVYGDNKIQVVDFDRKSGLATYKADFYPIESGGNVALFAPGQQMVAAAGLHLPAGPGIDIIGDGQRAIRVQEDGKLAFDTGLRWAGQGQTGWVDAKGRLASDQAIAFQKQYNDLMGLRPGNVGYLAPDGIAGPLTLAASDHVRMLA